MASNSYEFRVVEPARPDLPAGLQPRAGIARRRILILAANLLLNLVAWTGLGVLLSAAGWTGADKTIFISSLVFCPPLVFGLVNLVSGFLLRRTDDDGFHFAAPHALTRDRQPAISSRTAIILTLRNDPVDNALDRFKLLRNSLESTGEVGHFSFFVLSDTSDPVLARREELLVHEWNASLPDYAPVTYRRRLVNAGYQAGNLADFCRNWGEHFEFFVPMTPSTFMTGQAIVEMVRVMQAHPKIGIVQALAIAAPSQSAFARFRGFVERVHVGLDTLGQAWWRADCADYDGHNAIVRVKPFYLHCRMPHLSGRAPFGGAVLMHERIESAYMRRAGFEVRSLPVEVDHYSDRPETVFDMMRATRHAHYALWQLPRFIFEHGVSPIYRMIWTMQLLRALSPVGIILTMIALAFKPFDLPDLAGTGVLEAAAWFYIVFVLLIMAPLLIGVTDVLLSPARVRQFGGYIRLITSSVLAAILILVLYPALAFRSAWSFLASPFTWRDDVAIVAGSSISRQHISAFKSFWPGALFGVDLLLLMVIGSPAFAIWSLPLTIGFLVVIPVMWLMSSGWITAQLARTGLFGRPEIVNPPRELAQFIAQTHPLRIDRAA